MCLVVLAWRSHPRYRLIVAANRDEFFARPATAMQWWRDRPDILAGRDLQAGGTWLGVGRSGHFATLTNYREPQRPRYHKHSRGELVADYIDDSRRPLDYAGNLKGERYAGFSLLVADADSLVCVSNRDAPARALDAGVYGLSNAALDTPWPKLVRCRNGLHELLQRDAVNPAALMRMMADTTPAPVKDMDEHLPFAMARAVSAPFIRTPDYGTRCTTVVLADYDGHVQVQERRFDASGQPSGEDQFDFDTLTAT